MWISTNFEFFNWHIFNFYDIYIFCKCWPYPCWSTWLFKIIKLINFINITYYNNYKIITNTFFHLLFIQKSTSIIIVLNIIILYSVETNLSNLKKKLSPHRELVVNPKRRQKSLLYNRENELRVSPKNIKVKKTGQPKKVDARLNDINNVRLTTTRSIIHDKMIDKNTGKSTTHKSN